MIIELNNINKAFGKNNVLKNVSFKCKSGKAFGLLGRNGSGKTTIIRIIMDIFKGDSGEILFDGEKTNKNNFNIGYLPEERGLYPKVIIQDQMIYFGELRGLSKNMAKERMEYLLNKIKATEYKNRRLETLSKGNQQKIQLAIALIADPDIIILDEPFSGLDPVNSMILKDLIRDEVNNNKLVIFSSHQMSNVEEFCDDIAIINNGEIVLNGNLNEIKLSYPKDKVFIKPSDDKNIIDLFDNNLKEMILDYKKFNGGYKLFLSNEDFRNDLLVRLIEENIDLESFFVMEPSLEEIFIEKAGDNFEE